MTNALPESSDLSDELDSLPGMLVLYVKYAPTVRLRCTVFSKYLVHSM